MEKLLTIAIPTYNRRELLRRALLSTLSQITAEIEVLVSDNASTDGTEEMVLGLKQMYPKIVYIRNETNIGSDGNFLQCYQKSSGKYVMLLGSDDILIGGAIEHIIHFLKNDELTLTFLNHTAFKNEYIDLQHCEPCFLKKETDFVTTDKIRYMSYAKYQMTFMSDFILNRQAVLDIETPQQYSGTHFIHTCLTFAATKDSNAKLGVIFYPCVARDSTDGNSAATGYEIFAKWQKYVLVNVSIRFGYDEKQMNKIFCNRGCEMFLKSIGSDKILGTFDSQDFWQNCYPYVKMYPKAWVTIMPALLIPGWIWRPIKKLYRKIKHKG